MLISRNLGFLWLLFCTNSDSKPQIPLVSQLLNRNKNGTDAMTANGLNKTNFHHPTPWPPLPISGEGEEVPFGCIKPITD